MKGKISFYYNAPNVSRVRTRIENPSKELTRKLRDALQEAAIDTLNENILSMRAKMIAKFSTMEQTVKDKKYLDQLQNVMNNYFDAIFQATPFAGADDDETEPAPEPTAEPAPAAASAKSDDFE